MIGICSSVNVKKEFKIINFIQCISHTGTGLINPWLLCNLLPVTQFMLLAETLRWRKVIKIFLVKPRYKAETILKLKSHLSLEREIDNLNKS